MSRNPDRVTVAEINDLMSAERALSHAGAGTPLAERIAFHERKADVFSRIAAELDTAAAHETAAQARQQLIRLQTEAAWTAREGGDA